MSLAASVSCRVCSICERQFQSLQGNRKYCSSRCTKLAGRILSKPSLLKTGQASSPFQIGRCTQCQTVFATKKESDRCVSCSKQTISLPIESAEEAQEVIIKPLSKRKQKASPFEKLACRHCVYWVPTPGAELGYSCQIAFFTRCKPYQPSAQPFKHKHSIGL